LRRLWEAHSSQVEVRAFLLKLIWLGAIRDCADIASHAAYGAFGDGRTPYLAACALLAAGDADQRRTYAEHIREHIPTTPNEVLVAAIEELFPEFLSVDDLVAVVASERLDDDGGGGSLKWSCGELLARVASADELTRLIRALMALDASRATGDEGSLPGENDDTIEFALSAAADRLLEISPPDVAPEAAIDAVLSFARQRGMPLSSSNSVLSRHDLCRLEPAIAARRHGLASG
jgi:hypothetical protein